MHLRDLAHCGAARRRERQVVAVPRVVGLQHQAAVARDIARQHAAFGFAVEREAVEGLLRHFGFRIRRAERVFIDTARRLRIRSVHVLQVPFHGIRCVVVRCPARRHGQILVRHDRRDFLVPAGKRVTLFGRIIGLLNRRSGFLGNGVDLGPAVCIEGYGAYFGRSDPFMKCGKIVKMVETHAVIVAGFCIFRYKNMPGSGCNIRSEIPIRFGDSLESGACSCIVRLFDCGIVRYRIVIGTVFRRSPVFTVFIGYVIDRNVQTVEIKIIGFIKCRVHNPIVGEIDVAAVDCFEILAVLDPVILGRGADCYVQHDIERLLHHGNHARTVVIPVECLF